VPIGLPVPPGFTITTEVCTYYYANKRTYPSALTGQMEAGSPRSSSRPARSSAI
jgi:phosphoenolpyruvate synthase/pyruvate phosphate dikinase